MPTHTHHWMASRNPLSGRAYDFCAWPSCRRVRAHRDDARDSSVLVIAHLASLERFEALTERLSAHREAMVQAFTRRMGWRS